MTERKQNDQPYHHGNLRATLLTAAVELVGELGPRAFTLREVARRAGVSHNAPYRHFASRDELLAAVAAEGFDQLAVSMTEAMGDENDPVKRLELCGVGYVDFALRHPHHLVAMFDLPPMANADCGPEKATGRNAFEVLVGCIRDAQKAGDLPGVDPMGLALTAWALVHGVAKLAGGGVLPFEREATLEFTRSACRGLMEGIRCR